MPIRRQLTVASPLTASQIIGAARDAIAGRDLRASVRTSLARTFEAQNVLLTDSGTSALVLALRMFAKPLAPVAMPAYACVDLIAAARRANIRVRFFDVDPQTLSPDMDSLRRVMAEGVSAVVVAHLYGFPADMPAVMKAAHDVGVPVIEIFTQGDMGTNLTTRRPDGNTLEDQFRRYEVAGAPHVDPWENLSFASDVDQNRSRPSGPPPSEPACQPADVTPTDFPNRYVFDAAWRNLDRWVRAKVPAPHGMPLELKSDTGPFRPDTAFVTDAYGNAKGGVRTPAVDVPTARWVGAKTGGFSCLFIGYKYPFTPAQLARLYPNDATYRSKLQRDVTRLRAQRWLTPEDGEEILGRAGHNR